MTSGQSRASPASTNTATAGAGAGGAIRPFTIDVPEEELDDLRSRINATKWPDREVDPSQGVQLETIQALADYWATDYDWRRFEERFAALPHFITEIDGVDIHFIHVRSERDDALPLIVTHGWPGSTVEQLKIIDPLTKPTEHGAECLDPVCARIRARVFDPALEIRTLGAADGSLSLDRTARNRSGEKRRRRDPPVHLRRLR